MILPLLLASAFAQPRVDFARDIQPILADACYHCHGPDAKTRKAGLRLDTKEGAFAPRKGRTTIVPGKSAASEVVRRLTAHDADVVMPPPDSNRKVSAAQVATIKTWIDQGATWGKHWAFVELPAKVDVPKVSSPWPRNDIDRFVLDRLSREKLAPSSEASRETWLRRVTLDLTGLPPSTKERDDFLADTSPAAFETVVDRLLKSPRYGERMAADWLDLARFADTHGYQMDRSRPVWPYRDWVVRAFNDNMRYDEFLTQQLAGDLLPRPTQSQRLATAFNRLHMQNEEGGIVEEEFRVAYVVDRVNTTGTAFLGMTFECTRCHDHKFDPLTQRDYYGLFAFFQNIDESGQTSYFTGATPVPALLLTTAEQDSRLAAMRKKVAACEAEGADLKESTAGDFRLWLNARGETPKEPDGLQGYYHFGRWKGGAVPNRVKGAPAARAHESPTPGADAAGLDGENGFVLPGVGHFNRADAFSLHVTMSAETELKRAVVLHHSRAPVDAGSRGYEILVEDGRVAVGLHHMWPGNSLKVRTKEKLPLKEMTAVTVTYDGSSRAAGLRVYLDGILADVDVVRDKLTKDITYGGEPDLAVGHRFRDNGFKGGRVGEVRVYSRELSALEAMVIARSKDVLRLWRTPAGKLVAAEREELRRHYLLAVDPTAATWRKQLHALRDDVRRFVEPIAEIMVMQELEAPKPAYVLTRGEYAQPGEKVTMTTPAVLPAFGDALPRNRLGLAKWLLRDDHPLTSRVVVNRLWQQMFGAGLVRTSDNFGTTGTPPTHPELLDWLARDFVASGWDVRHVLKRMALSATYRQASRLTPDLRERDPDNLLLARFPARRLTAEMLRDQALFHSGLLVEKSGGPSVYPYQPDGLWNEAMGRPNYPRSKGDDLYRRSLYTYWKRTAPHPQMTTFDAADRSVCNAKRQATSTPLQALALLNDPQFVEAARHLGERTLSAGDTDAKRIAWAFRLVVGREITAREATILASLVAEQRAAFKADPAAVGKLLNVGDRKPSPKLDRAELATMTDLALTLLNHDGATHRR